MKKRYLYSILFGIPGFFISVIAAFIAFGSTAGVLWLYVFGDNPWPAWSEKTLVSLFVLAFLVAWIATISVGFVAGKKLERNPALNRGHILISIGATIAPILSIALYQLSVGNIGPKSDDTLCSEFCRDKGFAASGTPPRNSGERNCSCLDASGHAALKVPMETIEQGKRRNR